MNCVKFMSLVGSKSLKEKYSIGRYVLQRLKFQCFCTPASKKIQTIFEDEDFLKKIVYNEVLQKQPIIEPDKYKTICLKYLMPDKNIVKEVKNDETEKETVHFPFQIKEDDENDHAKIFSESINKFTPSDKEEIEVPQWKEENYRINFRNIENPKKWAFEDVKQEENNNEVEDVFKFGSFNPNSPVSSVPCGGCGALLHCNDPKLPGFIPAELFEVKNKKELKGEKCQRCHFLKKFNVPLGVNVSPSEYKNLISSIKDKKALVIIMIDILDFPCSIFPGIFDLIGQEKPVVIVANKVDLLIQEEPEFERNFKESLMWSLKKQKINLQNVKHIELISAKTGYGVEKLIDLLYRNWEKGDIYLIGCTNVGKSSLFNTLIQSDFCKVKAVNLLQRATVSAWPGTTLNLLKFPIIKSFKWRLIARSKRLSTQIKEEKAFKKFQCLGQNISLEQIPLQEFVGRTFFNTEDPDDFGQPYDPSSDKQQKRIVPDDNNFPGSFWFYDTPGVVQQEQIINFLTAPELLLTVPRKMLLPRNFHLKPGSSLFIAGLARLDYISGADFVWFTVFASMELPITVTKIEDAEEVYQKLLGTPFFRVPVKEKKRLAKWPSLLSKKLEIDGKLPKFIPKKYKHQPGKFPKDADVDIVLSSAGWVSVNVPLGYRCKVEVWTPQGKGIYLRDLPIIKKGFTFRGPKISGTPAFLTQMKEVQKYSFIKTPSLYELYEFN